MECADPLSEALLGHGADSVSVEDACAGTERETPQFGEPGAAPGAAWAISRVSALFPRDADVAGILDACAREIALAETPAHRLIEVAEQDWVRLTQSQFPPFAIGDRLWIVPTWHAVPVAGAPGDAVYLRLDPGLAFGTGTHPTTRLCLRWLEANALARSSVLDYGCGSGILAIAAMKLGAPRACGVDIDPLALRAAEDNARRNGVDVAFAQPGRCEAAFDIVVANILANPLKLLAPLLTEACRPGGTLLLSGILGAQAGEVAAAYSRNFDLTVASEDETWVLLAGTRTC